MGRRHPKPTASLALVWALALASGTSAQESQSAGASVTKLVDRNRIDQLFAPSATAAAEPRIAFPGTAANRDDFSGDVPVFVPMELIEGLQQEAIPFAGTSRGFSDPSESALIQFDEAGYLASEKFDSFTMAVEGTKIEHGTSDQVSAAASEGVAPDYYHPFEPSETGGVVRFGFAGVDYLVTFECDVPPVETEEGEITDSCITGAEADAQVADFLLCNDDAQCVRHNPGVQQ